MDMSGRSAFAVIFFFSYGILSILLQPPSQPSLYWYLKPELYAILHDPLLGVIWFESPTNLISFAYPQIYHICLCIFELQCGQSFNFSHGEPIPLRGDIIAHPLYMFIYSDIVHKLEPYSSDFSDSSTDEYSTQ